MTFSINTNENALLALRTLTRTTRGLERTQTRVNTGLEVSSAKENATVFSIAQKLRTDLRGYSAVLQSLDRGLSTADIALAAAESVSDLLIEMKAKAVAASDPGIDTVSRNAFNEDFKAMRDQITLIVNNASFNDVNLIDASTDSVLAITNPDATQTLEVSHQRLALGTNSAILVTAGQEIATLTTALQAIDDIVASLSNVNNALTKLGAGATELEDNRTFAVRLSDVIEVGIGNLVDADLARESSRLQALQVKQQLGIEALSIANAAPQTILQLFQ